MGFPDDPTPDDDDSADGTDDDVLVGAVGAQDFDLLASLCPSSQEPALGLLHPRVDGKTGLHGIIEMQVRACDPESRPLTVSLGVSRDFGMTWADGHWGTAINAITSEPLELSSAPSSLIGGGVVHSLFLDLPGSLPEADGLLWIGGTLRLEVLEPGPSEPVTTGTLDVGEGLQVGLLLDMPSQATEPPSLPEFASAAPTYAWRKMDELHVRVEASSDTGHYVLKVQLPRCSEGQEFPIGTTADDVVATLYENRRDLEADYPIFSLRGYDRMWTALEGRATIVECGGPGSNAIVQLDGGAPSAPIALEATRIDGNFGRFWFVTDGPSVDMEPQQIVARARQYPWGWH